MTRLLTALTAATVTVMLAIAAPAGAGAHEARRAPHRHAHHVAKHAKGTHKHSHSHGRSHRRHTHKRSSRHHSTVRPRKRHGKHATHTEKPSSHTHAEHVQGAQGADAGGCAGADLRPGPENIEAVREATLCLINRERVTRGERALTFNGKLQHAAQSHSESMASGDYFSHEGPGGSTPLSRIRSTGYISSSKLGYEVGENIAWGTLWLATPKAIVEGWMSSPGHRANILNPNYRDTGVGVSPHPPVSRAEGQAGGVYTQDFGVIIAG